MFELSHEIDYLLWIFKKIKILKSFNKKISNLKIDVDDILILNGITPKKTIINLTINFFQEYLTEKYSLMVKTLVFMLIF